MTFSLTCFSGDVERAGYLLCKLAKMLSREGLRYRSGNIMATATVHKVLRNRVYSGEFEWAGPRFSRSVRTTHHAGPVESGSGGARPASGHPGKEDRP